MTATLMPNNRVLRIASVSCQNTSWPRLVVPKTCGQPGGTSERRDEGVQCRIRRDIRKDGKHENDTGQAGADGEFDIGAQQVTQSAPHQRASTRGSSSG